MVPIEPRGVVTSAESRASQVAACTPIDKQEEQTPEKQPDATKFLSCSPRTVLVQRLRTTTN